MFNAFRLFVDVNIIVKLKIKYDEEDKQFKNKY